VTYLEGEFEHLKGPIKDMMVQYKGEIDTLKDEIGRQRSDFRSLLDEYVESISTDASTHKLLHSTSPIPFDIR
jgi:hypothetical protein